MGNVIRFPVHRLDPRMRRPEGQDEDSVVVLPVIRIEASAVPVLLASDPTQHCGCALEPEGLLPPFPDIV